MQEIDITKNEKQRSLFTGIGGILKSTDFEISSCEYWHCFPRIKTMHTLMSHTNRWGRHGLVELNAGDYQTIVIDNVSTSPGREMELTTAPTITSTSPRSRDVVSASRPSQDVLTSHLGTVHLGYRLGSRLTTSDEHPCKLAVYCRLSLLVSKKLMSQWKHLRTKYRHQILPSVARVKHLKEYDFRTDILHANKFYKQAINWKG